MSRKGSASTSSNDLAWSNSGPKDRRFSIWRLLSLASRTAASRFCIVAIKTPPAPEQTQKRVDLVCLCLALGEPLLMKARTEGFVVLVFFAPEHNLLRICTVL